jgi:hypothetical protein
VKVKLDNLDRDDGTVLAWTSAQEAQGDITIDGCRWEYPSDLEGDAYAILTDRPGLVRDLKQEEYDLDCSEYMEPQDLQDLVH